MLPAADGGVCGHYFSPRHLKAGRPLQPVVAVKIPLPLAAVSFKWLLGRIL